MVVVDALVVLVVRVVFEVVAAVVVAVVVYMGQRSVLISTMKIYMSHLHSASGGGSSPRHVASALRG